MFDLPLLVLLLPVSSPKQRRFGLFSCPSLLSIRTDALPPPAPSSPPPRNAACHYRAARPQSQSMSYSRYVRHHRGRVPVKIAACARARRRSPVAFWGVIFPGSIPN